MARMPSVMAHDFSRVPRAEIPRSSFDRSHGLKTAFDSGYLIPIFVDEAMPGDTFNLNATAFGRLATPLRPFMDNVFVNTFFFFVPYRLIWDNFQKFMGEQDNPGDSTDYIVPYVCSPPGTGYAINSIHDYMGIPTGVGDLCHSALPLRAYNLIWNQWFRDQNLQNSVPVRKGDTGSDNIADYGLLRRGKRHDYFTSSLPWPQKGSAVDIPLGQRAPVVGLGKVNQSWIGASGAYETGASGPRTYASAAGLGSAASPNDDWVAEQDPGNPGFPGIYADLTQATAATINQLRQAFQIQKLHERDARGGTRYTEIIRAHFNVVSPDARLQRPEYLGGGQGIVNLHQVAQTTPPVADGSPQANLAAYGTTQFSGHGFTKSFTEHGVILGLASVRADLNYQQGLNRMWKRETKYDFFWPALSMIGEQAVMNSEIYAQGFSAPGNPDDQAWGYQERYAEYRYKPSMVTGEMRSTAPQPLDTWHLAQHFTAAPALNAAFIEDNPPMARVLAVPSERQFIFDFYFSLRCARPMPTYGVPGLIDHF